jgi:putative heme-binding domain-containing protein
MSLSPLLTSLSLFVSLAPAAEWPTAQVQGTPEPPYPFVAESVFAEIPLKNVTDMVPVPGLGQWLIAENAGSIWCLADDLTAKTAHLAIDLKALHPACDHVYGLAFHPQFASNRQIYITYTVGNKKRDGSRLSRFRVIQETPLLIDPTSEEVLLTWLSGGHNGAAIAFGPDGYLYLSTGDAEVPNPADPLNTGQDLSDLLSSILRIDVDRTANGKPYAVPADNPFLHTPGARPENWAYGFRNPWKISFDKKTGHLWCGDVGWQEWESIYLVTPGGNYGWPATEGHNVLDRSRYRGPSPISPPVISHSHAEAASITGGFVYRGSRLPDLIGAYLYADYETGKIWALWHDGQQILRHQEIADTPYAIVTFAQAEDGELYFVHYAGTSTIHRLQHNPDAGKPPTFPLKLSQTGLFSDLTNQVPAPGVQPFAIHAPMWADGATATRYVAMNGSIQTPEGRPRAKKTWPKDAVLAKTLRLELTQGDPSTAKNIETQLLHFTGETWNAYSYRWNDTGTDADLVGSAGDERLLKITGKDFPNGQHHYRYRFHSRAECLRCHNAWGDFALSFNPMQLAAPDQLLSAGFFDAAFLQSSDHRLVNPQDSQADLEARARSWLHSNCASCHREHGGGSVPLIVNAELPTTALHALDQPPSRGDFGIPDARVIAPGQPSRSILLHRIAKTGSGHMPMLGAHQVDIHGLQLLAEWICQLAPDQPQIADSQDPASALNLVLKIDRGEVDPQQALAAAKTSPSPHIRELFERYLPDSERLPTLGPTINPDAITQLQGDAQRGAQLFIPTGKAATCTACHFLQGHGRDFGPDLSKVGSRLTPTQIIESLLSPSKTIADGFHTTLLTLKDNRVQTGFIIKRETEQLTLKIPSGQALTVKTSDIQTEQTLPTSLMPEGLLQGFTAQEAADMAAYLSHLK